MSDFGKNPDGTNRNFGQLSKDEQMAVLRGVCVKLKAEFEHPAMQAAITRRLDGLVEVANWRKPKFSNPSFLSDEAANWKCE